MLVWFFCTLISVWPLDYILWGGNTHTEAGYDSIMETICFSLLNSIPFPNSLPNFHSFPPFASLFHSFPPFASLSHSFLLPLPFLFLSFLNPSYFPSHLGPVPGLIHLFLFILICINSNSIFKLLHCDFVYFTCPIPFHTTSVFYLIVNAIQSPYFVFIFAEHI